MPDQEKVALDGVKRQLGCRSPAAANDLMPGDLRDKGRRVEFCEWRADHVDQPPLPGYVGPQVPVEDGELTDLLVPAQMGDAVRGPIAVSGFEVGDLVRIESEHLGVVEYVIERDPRGIGVAGRSQEAAGLGNHPLPWLGIRCRRQPRSRGPECIEQENRTECGQNSAYPSRSVVRRAQGAV